MDLRELSTKYADIGDELIQREEALEYIKESEARIIFLSSQHEKKSKGRTIHAECEKISDKYKWGIPGDFTITVFEPNVREFTEEQIKILLFHELLHVGITPGEEEKYSIVPHDLEDFKVIIDRFGTEWDG